jgi:dipeptidyl aminopeptidase/acylaminoacyl peptidase
LFFPALRAGEVFTPLHAARLRAVVSAHVSPSGRHLAYVLAVPRDAGKEPSGPSWQEREARRVYSASSDIAAFSLSPDGGRIAFIASDPPPEKEEKLKEQGFNQEAYEEEHRPVRVQLAELARPEAPPVPLNVEGFASEVHWAPRGDRIALVVAPTPLVDDSYMSRRIRVVDAASSAVVARIESAGKLGPLAWNPSGSRLAFISGEDEHDPSPGRLMTAAADGSDRKQILTEFQGHFLSLAWKDDQVIAYLAAEGVWTSLGEVRHDGTGQAVRIPPGKAVLSGFSLSRDGRTAVMVGEGARHPPEVLVLGPQDGEPRRATSRTPGSTESAWHPRRPSPTRPAMG